MNDKVSANPAPSQGVTPLLAPGTGPADRIRTTEVTTASPMFGSSPETPNPRSLVTRLEDATAESPLFESASQAPNPRSRVTRLEDATAESPLFESASQAPNPRSRVTRLEDATAESPLFESASQAPNPRSRVTRLEDATAESPLFESASQAFKGSKESERKLTRTTQNESALPQPYVPKGGAVVKPTMPEGVENPFTNIKTRSRLGHFVKTGGQNPFAAGQYGKGEIVGRERLRDVFVEKGPLNGMGALATRPMKALARNVANSGKVVASSVNGGIQSAKRMATGQKVEVQDRPAHFIDRLTPAKQFALEALTSTFMVPKGVDSKTELVARMGAYTDNMPDNSSITVAHSSSGKAGPYIPIDAILTSRAGVAALGPVELNAGVDISWGRDSGFDLTKKPGDSYELKLSVTRTNGAVGKATIAGKVSESLGLKVFGYAGLGADDKRAQTLTVKLSGDETKDFLKKYVEGKLSISGFNEGTEADHKLARTTKVKGKFGVGPARSVEALLPDGHAANLGRGGTAYIGFAEPGWTKGSKVKEFKSTYEANDSQTPGANSMKQNVGPTKVTREEPGGFAVNVNTGVDVTVGLELFEAGTPVVIKDATRAIHENNQLRTGVNVPYEKFDGNEHTATVQASKFESWSALGSSPSAALTTIEKYIGPNNAGVLMDEIEDQMKKDHGPDFTLNRRELTFKVVVKLDPEVEEEIKTNAESKFPSPMYHPRFVAEEIRTQKKKILTKPSKHENKVSFEVTPNLAKKYSTGLKSGLPFVYTANNVGAVGVKQNFETTEFLDKQ